MTSWIDGASFGDLYDHHESQAFVFYEHDSDLRSALLDYHDGTDEPSPEKMDDYVRAYNAMAKELSGSGCMVEYATSSGLGHERMETNGWGWFTVNNPDTESACYEMARAALEKFNVLIGLEGV